MNLGNGRPQHHRDTDETGGADFCSQCLQDWPCQQLAAPTTPNPHYEYTCDAGNCDKPTIAIILTLEELWISMCWKHARREMDAIKLAELRGPTGNA